MLRAKADAAFIDAVFGVLREHGVPLLQLLSIGEKLVSGAYRAVLTQTADGAAVLVVQERETWRQVVVGCGPESALLTSLEELRSSSDALLWDASALSVDGEKLDALDFRLLLRQVFTQELSLVPRDHPDATGLEIALLSQADHQAARDLFAKTHANNVEGLFTTWPSPPTVSRCASAFDGYLSGAQGKVVEQACVAIRDEGRVVGVICCAASDTAETGVLLGLAVDPTVRGRGLSRILVRRAQRGLHDAGFARMLFLTTDRNAPVHRLFTPEEIVSTESFPTRLWLRAA